MSFNRLGAAVWIVLAAAVLSACANQQLSQLPDWIQIPNSRATQTPQTPPSITKPPQSDAARPKTTTAPAAPTPAPADTSPPNVVPEPAPGSDTLAARSPEPPAATDRLPPLVPPLANRTPPGGDVQDTPDDRFATPPPPPLKPSVPRVAVLLPLSGANAKLGQEMLNAAQLALFHFADRKFELLPHDTKGTPEGAAEAAALAIGDGASLILGPLLSTSVRAVAPAARAAGVPVIAFSNDRSIAGEGVFAMGFLPREEVLRVISYARSRGISRFAALAPDNEYGRRIVESMMSATQRSGGTVTHIEMYDPATRDFAPIIRRLANYERRRQSMLAQKSQLENRTDEVARQALARLQSIETAGDVPFEALLVADGGKRLQAIAALLPYYDIDPKRIRMLGTGQWDFPGIGTEPAMVGGWFAAPSPELRIEFERQYKQVYGAKPERLTTLAYDATALASVLTKGKTKIDMRAITSAQGFSGRDGIFRFLAEGTAERGLTVLQVGERDTRVISKSPESFSQRAN